RLNCLDAATGAKVWSADVAADSGAKAPMWGFAASPLVAAGIVTVFAGGPNEKSVLGYKASTGVLAWSAGEGKHSYCSMHPATLGGVDQLVVSTERGLAAYDPTGGAVLWKHSFPLEEGYCRVVQPTLLEGGDMLIGMGMGVGTRRVHINHADKAWATK